MRVQFDIASLVDSLGRPNAQGVDFGNYGGIYDLGEIRGGGRGRGRPRGLPRGRPRVVMLEVVREVEADPEVHERPQNPLVISNLD